MTQVKHTPGPWRLVWWGNEAYPYPLSILAENDGAWIARDGHVSSDANARLIAAAPDMLEALRGMLRLAEAANVSERIICHEARAAIARATGEKP